MKNLFALSFAIAVFFSARYLQIPTQQSAITIQAEALVVENDVWQVFYSTDSLPFFEEKRSVRLAVHGSPRMQTLIFQLPSHSDLAGFRLDPGSIGTNLQLRIKNVSLRRGLFNSISFDLEKDFESFKLIRGEKAGNYIIDNRDGITDPMLIFKGTFPTLEKNNRLGYLSWFQGGIPFILAFFTFFRARRIEFAGWNILEISLVGIFFCLCFLPIMVDGLNLEQEQTNQEKRKLAIHPGYALKVLFNGSYDAFFQDNFPLRQWFLHLDAYLKAVICKSTTNPNLVLIGKDGWKFNSDNIAYDSYSYDNRFNKSQLQGFMEAHDSIQQSLDSMGVVFVRGFWPNKGTIYPEKIPWNLKIQTSNKQSLADQIVAEMKRKGFFYFDVREELLKAKKTQELYFPDDSHWNFFGGFEGYKAFCNQTKEMLGLVPFSYTDFNQELSKESYYNLNQLLGLRNEGTFQQQRQPIELIPKDYLPQVERKYMNTPGAFQTTINPDAPNKKTVLVFADSFMVFFWRYLSLHYAKVIYFNTWENKVSLELVQTYQPDIVLLASLEQFLHINFK